MDQEIRNKLRNVVTQCRKLLEDSISQELEGKYGIFAKKDHLPNRLLPLVVSEVAGRDYPEGSDADRLRRPRLRGAGHGNG